MPRIKTIFNPRKRAGRPTFVLDFQNPRVPQGKRNTVSLECTDSLEARAICADLKTLYGDQELWQASPDDPRFAAYHPRALSIFFPEHAEHFRSRRAPVVFSEEDVAQIIENATKLFQARLMDLSKELVDRAYVQGNEPLQNGDFERYSKVLLPSDLPEMLKDVVPQAFRQIRNIAVRQANQIKSMRLELEYYRIENARLAQLSNIHCDATVGTALSTWERSRKSAYSRQTLQQMKHSVESFIATLEGKRNFRLGDVKRSHIRAWMDQLAGEDGAPLNPNTKMRQKAYLSAFYSWCMESYDLHDHPVRSIKGSKRVKHGRHEIPALKTPADTVGFLKMLEPYPYWQAWCAIAILAGPRFSEQCRMKIEQINVKDGYIAIFGAKTGVLRHVAIEQSILKPVLSRFLKIRAAQRAAPDRHNLPSAAASDLLFPALVPPGPTPRTKTDPNMWSHNSAWRGSYERVRDTIRATLFKDREAPYFFDYGPSEWRHTFGTILSAVGIAPGQAADYMGNSPTAYRAHYARPHLGKKWAFKYE